MLNWPPNPTSAFTVLGVKETGVAIQQVFNQVNDLNRESSRNFIAAAHETTTSLTGNELRKDLRKWIAPPDPSVNFNTASDAHHEGTAEWCTKGNTVAAWKTCGSLLWIHGKRTYPVTICVLCVTNNISWIDSWLGEKCSQVRLSFIQLRLNRIYMVDQLHDHSGHQIYVRCRLSVLGLFFLRFQGRRKTRLSCSIIVPSRPTLEPI